MKRLLILVFLLSFVTPSFAAEISEADVKAFLENWLSAQNRGAFTDYADLYAGRFLGIKRSGDRKRRYNRQTWLKDRKHFEIIRTDDGKKQDMKFKGSIDYDCPC
jgi:hypothetical protein